MEPQSAHREGTSPLAGCPGSTIGRVPILDVRPSVHGGRRPAKAVEGETFEVTATVFGEGHEAIGAAVVLRDPEGRPGPRTPMRELEPGTDRWGAEVTPTSVGHWTFLVEAWKDPVTTWRREAEIKIPARIDVALVLEEGADLYERAAAGVPEGPLRDTVRAAVEALRDESRPPVARLAAVSAPEVVEVLARFPLRVGVSWSGVLPLVVERERALF
ncbi:maltotransferase domain-containing protein, partial [Streptomyces nodosus]